MLTAGALAVLLAGPAHTCAVVWIDEDGASVARSTAGGGVEVRSIDRDRDGQRERRRYLTRVVHEIGDRERVVILGPGRTRTELERAYVMVFKRPDRLVDVEPAEAAERDRLVDRLLTLAG